MHTLLLYFFSPFEIFFFKLEMFTLNKCFCDHRLFIAQTKVILLRFCSHERWSLSANLVLLAFIHIDVSRLKRVCKCVTLKQQHQMISAFFYRNIHRMVKSEKKNAKIVSEQVLMCKNPFTACLLSYHSVRHLRFEIVFLSLHLFFGVFLSTNQVGWTLERRDYLRNSLLLDFSLNDIL